MYFRNVTELHDADAERERLISASDRQRRIYEAARLPRMTLPAIRGVVQRIAVAVHVEHRAQSQYGVLPAPAV